MLELTICASTNAIGIPLIQGERDTEARLPLGCTENWRVTSGSKRQHGPIPRRSAGRENPDRICIELLNVSAMRVTRDLPPSAMRLI
jgi:hypothetical protein